MPNEDLGFCYTCDVEILRDLSKGVAGTDFYIKRITILEK